MRTVDDTGGGGFLNFLNFFLEDSCGNEKFGIGWENYKAERNEKKSEE